MNFFSTLSKIIFIFSVTAFIPFLSLSQEKIGNESLAIEYFRAGNYEKALPLFAQLVRTNPDNAMYNYYYGVSLVKNNIFETAAKEALLNAVVDKTPANSNFYLANYFHALENWQEAMDFYDRYDGMASRQERKALQFDYYFDLCRKKVNPFQVKTAANQNTIFVDTVKKNGIQPDEKNFPVPEALLLEWFNFQVNEVLVYHTIDDFKSEAGKVLFTKAWLNTGKNDSIVAVTDSLRKEHEKTVRVSTRLDLVTQIVDSEQKSYQLLREREKLFEQARVKEAVWWEKAGDSAMNEFKVVLLEKENAHEVALKKIAEESKKAEAVVLAAAAEKVPEYIEEPQDVENAVKSEATSDNIVYKVQIGSFKNGVLTSSFKTLLAKLSKFRKIDHFTDEKKYEIYTVGSFTNYNDVSKLKEQLVIEGAKGAFVVAYNNGVKIPVTEAKKITESNQDISPKK
jgi:tetratricopeptide (TPR) repeat protein